LQSVIQFLKRHASNVYLTEKGLVGGTVFLAVAMLAVIWVGTWVRVSQEKALTVENSIADGKNIAAIVASNLNEVLGRATLYSQNARSMMDADPSAVLQLNPTRNGDRAYLRIAVFDERARLVQSSANRTSEPELMQLVLLAQSNTLGPIRDDHLIVGKPSCEDHSAWRVLILIPFTSAAQGRGFFTAIIDLGYFLQLYKDVNLGDTRSIEIFTHDA